ncbi:MAG: CamS sex pheromone family protein [Erysipelotrichaceae bacterium]|nr:MAG: CamS sex pheromone family [Erysipelotrichaceae bacterium]TXT17164.1 MAG: CamS sex pheromone family protein [Erysipelotrichaceae bacterium]
MKKIGIILCLITLLGSCAAPIESPKATIIESKDPKDYDILVPFEASSIRYNHGIYTGVIDMLDIGLRLQEHAKKVFSVDEYHLAEGQILDIYRVNNLLKREGTDNPYGLNPPKGSQFETGIGNIKILDAVLVADIFEINFYKGSANNPVLSGIGFALVFNQSMEIDGVTTLISDEKLKEYALTAGRKLERYIRTIQGLETLNIYMALYSTEKIDATLPGHFFAEATFSAREGQFADLDEEWVFFPSQAALVKDIPNSTSFAKFRNTIVDFVPEAIGTIGEGLYVEGELSHLKITVNLQAKTYTEVYALTQTIISLLDEFNHTKYDIIVKVVSNFQTVVLIKLSIDDQLNVIIAP